MYENFFGFREKPFNITPNPRFIFLSKTHQEVFAHLLYGLQSHAGFIEITGEVGTGKTTILRTLFEQLDEQDYRLALIFNPRLSVLDLLRSINREFGLPVGTGTHLELTDQLNRFLLEENRAGRTPVLVIDEAQNLTSDVLEQIRLLSNLETATDKLIQIVLVGQPELGRNLDRPELRQLNQRITVRYHLGRLDYSDSCAYIRHRLQVAGCEDPGLFTPAALKQIFRLSGGLPRLINVICDRACLVAFTEGQARIDRRAVRQAQAELQRSEDRALPRHLPWAALLVPVFLVLIAGLWWTQRQPAAVPITPKPEPAGEIARTLPVAAAIPAAASADASPPSPAAAPAADTSVATPPAEPQFAVPPPAEPSAQKPPTRAVIAKMGRAENKIRDWKINNPADGA